MFSYNKSGELRVDPSELLVSTGQPLFDRLNNARGEGPGGVAAVRLPETAGRVFRRTDINPMGIVEDYAVACEAANRKEKGKIPGQRALLTGGPKETERAFASLQGRLRALNSVLEEVIQQALSPYINPEKHRVVSWLNLRNHDAQFFQATSHSDPELVGFYLGEVRRGGPRHFVDFAPTCTNDLYENRVRATIGPMPDNTLVVYRNEQWSPLGLPIDPADDRLPEGFNSHAYATYHGSDPGTLPDARRTFGFGRLAIKGPVVAGEEMIYRL